MTRSKILVFLFLALSTAGCKSKLNLDETINDGKEYGWDGVANEQKIKIHAKPTEGKITVGVYLEKNKKAAGDHIFSGKNDPFLAIERGKEEVNMEVTVPANENWHVQVVPVGAGRKSIAVKITN